MLQKMGACLCFGENWLCLHLASPFLCLHMPIPSLASLHEVHAPSANLPPVALLLQSLSPPCWTRNPRSPWRSHPQSNSQNPALKPHLQHTLPPRHSPPFKSKFHVQIKANMQTKTFPKSSSAERERHTHIHSETRARTPTSRKITAWHRGNESEASHNCIQAAVNDALHVFSAPPRARWLLLLDRSTASPSPLNLLLLRTRCCFLVDLLSIQQRLPCCCCRYIATSRGQRRSAKLAAFMPEARHDSKPIPPTSIPPEDLSNSRMPPSPPPLRNGFSEFR